MSIDEDGSLAFEIGGYYQLSALKSTVRLYVDLYWRVAFMRVGVSIKKRAANPRANAVFFTKSSETKELTFFGVLYPAFSKSMI